jgi:hypothetical protein
MLKKYLPVILLISAAIMLYWIKTNQRGKHNNINISREIPAVNPGPVAAANDPIDRTTNTIVYSKHARCRMACRHIDETEVKEILTTGVINYSKVEETGEGKSYPLEGVTHDNQHVRIVFAPHENKLVVVTVIDLDTEWTCNCN